MTVWRIVLSVPQIASLSEIELHWDLCDVEDAHEILDLRGETLDWMRTRQPKPED